jgi:cytochrome c peroxidase
MKKKFLIFTLLVGALILKSCKKDPQAVPTEAVPYTTTPFVLVHEPWYPPFDLPLDNPLTEEGVMLGRMLFYDPILSGDSTLSCNNCHQQSKAFSDQRVVSVGITGQLGNRNSMPLHNQMWNKHFFWDGRAKSLKEQVLIPIQAHDEMNMNLYTLIDKLENTERYKSQFKKAFNVSEIEPTHISKALEQFIVTMISFNAQIDKLWHTPDITWSHADTLKVISESALRGLNIFMQPTEDGGADCFHCHSNIPFFGTISISGSMSNNGLDAVHTDLGFGNITGKFEDKGKFKIPSLRNIARSSPYMHDGRFQTLQEVIDFYSDNIQFSSPNLDTNIDSHKTQLNLSTQQKTDIIEFLKTLTDTTYLNNPNLKSPF